MYDYRANNSAGAIHRTVDDSSLEAPYRCPRSLIAWLLINNDTEGSMTTFRTAILLTIALTVSAAAHGQASAPSKQERATAAKTSEKAKRSVPSEGKPADIDRLVLKAMIDAFAINKASKIYFTDKTTTCDVQTANPPPPPTTPTCTNTVKITELFNSTGDLVACSVSVTTGDIKINYGSPPRRPKVTINWDLEYPSGQKGKDYAFDDKFGLLILKNDNGATGSKLDGWSKARIQLDHHWKKTNDEIYYYPLVIQTLQDGTVTLCGATDPRITND